ncbi:MAG TPA: hypothetical protein VFS08_15815 [Gemmatimonadaceae bacterium]|nr:hypothetical protein [Gemmatimonadaceae bacterium]
MDEQDPPEEELSPEEIVARGEALGREFARIGIEAGERFRMLLPVATFEEGLAWRRSVPDGVGRAGLAEHLARRVGTGGRRPPERDS